MDKKLNFLSIIKISKRFGGFYALEDVNIEIESGERRAIIGPNGAGKSTLFNVINGHLLPSSGEIIMGSVNLTKLLVHKRWQLGMARTFQRNNLFLGLTAEQNVRLAVQASYGLGKRLLSSPKKYPKVDQEIDRVLDDVKLGYHRDIHAQDMAYGQQRQLELAIALAGRPKILLLDEPTAGMSPAETKEMIDMLKGLPRELTILIIEHDMDVIFSLADRVTVLHFGRVLSEGSPEHIEQDHRVYEIYLGKKLERKFQ